MANDPGDDFIWPSFVNNRWTGILIESIVDFRDRKP